MSWTVRFVDAFSREFDQFAHEVQDEMLARARLLQQFGPTLSRPWVDTLNGSRHANMKELRFQAAGGVWRLDFAFDRRREAILLIAGDKSGGSGRRFYQRLVAEAYRRFDDYLVQTGQADKRRR